MDDQYVIRLSDAHLWVEVYYPGKGWKAYDPTPATDEAAIFRQHVGMLEKMKMKWFVHVIQYDTSSQTAITAFMMNTVIKAWAWFVNHALKSLYTLLVPMGCALLIVLFRIRHRLHFPIQGWRLTGKKGKKLAWVRSYFGRYLRVIERKGYKRMPSTTPIDLIATMEKDSVTFINDARFLTNTFYHTRFGGNDLSKQEKTDIKQAIKRIVRS